MINTIKNLRAIAAGALLTVAATAAHAAPVFTANPGNLGLSTVGGIPVPSQFQADSMSGVSSARITYTGMSGGTYNYSGVGYIDFSTFALNGSSLSSGVTFANFSYDLFATFTQTFACSAKLAPGVSCSITSINLGLYADPGDDNVYHQATLGSDASVTVVGPAIQLGIVNAILPVVPGFPPSSAGIDASGGGFQNVNINFILTPQGKQFFVSPDPFYAIAFSAFNNTSQGLQCDGTVTATAPNGCSGDINTVALTQEVGVTDFNGTRVPEPASLAIFGAGLMGLGFLRRRKA